MRAPSLLLLVACGPAAPGGSPPDTDPVEVVVDTARPPDCTRDADCDDGNPCTGVEACSADGACLPGAPVACDAPATCVVDGEDAVCAVLCDLPRAPVLDVLRPDDTLHFSGAQVQTAVLAPEDDQASAVWTDDALVALTGRSGPVRVLARSTAEACAPDDRFDHVYEVRDAYPGAAGTPGSATLPADDARFLGWAVRVDDVRYGDAVDAAWRVPERALGQAAGTSTDVVSLGRGGSVTLGFDPPIRDGDGHDFAVFENGFADTFLELAFVEVSSDGQTFVRFDSAAHTPDPVSAFGSLDPAAVHGLAGAHRQGFGTPFDLAWLRFHPAVRAGQLNLDAVSHVRVVDVVGDGTARDAFGRTVHDPYPTTGSAGFDLDAIGVIHGSAR